MDETGIHEQVKRWLGQKEHQALLEHISKGCLFELEKRGLSHIVFLDTNPSVEDRQREILSCLFHFLLENSHIHAVLITGERNKTAVIKRSFINHLTEQARSKDAFRKVYRNAQAAIRNSGNLDIKQQSDKALYFFFTQQKNLQPVLMTKDDLQEIEFPESICPNHTYSQMNRKKILAPLAEYFLEKTGHVFETTAPCVSLNMLVEWIGIHVPFSAGRAPSTTIEHTTDNGFYHAEAVECASAFSNRLSATDPGDVYLLAGTFAPEIDIPLVPSWAKPLIGTDTFESFQTAEKLVRRTTHPRLKGSFHIYPLLKPDNRIKFTGRSAGLPAVLLLLSSAENRKLEPSFSATGCIDSSGSIFPSKRIKEKIKALAEMNFRLILHPASVSSDPDQTSNFVKCVPVSNTDEAWLFAGMYTHKNETGILRLNAMMQSVPLFISGLSDIDFKFLMPAVENGFFDEIIKTLHSEPAYFELFSKTLTENPCFIKNSVPEKEFLCSLIDIKVIENQEGTDDESLLRFLTFRLNTANNSGKVNETGPLVKIGKNCIDKKTCSLEPIIEFLNNRVVATHNLYQFQPDNESIKTAEKLNSINKTSKVYGASIDTVFARFSGTLSQNFGFCGPGYLKDFTKWNMKARKAFGEFLQENAKYRSEWLRQYNYGVYAFLDAGKTLQAKQMLCKYLSVEAPEDVPVRDSPLSLSPWEHAVFARFCAETELTATGMRYVESTALSGKIKPPCHHPWQLWLKNCALIAEAAGEKKAARNLLLKSLEICLHKRMGPTVHMMALMPLFYLHKYSRLEPDVDLKSIQGRLFKAMKCLHVPHFKIISSNRSLRSAFHDTSFSLEKLFPFAFR